MRTSVDGVVVFFLLVVLVIIGVPVYMLFQYKGRKAKSIELRAIKRVWVGSYVTGLPTADDPIGPVDCAITEDNFVFLGGFGKELGRIPRDKINQIFVDDKSTITQRLTVTRMLTLGIFSLAAPKRMKHPEYCLLVDWDDGNGLRHNTIFDFTGERANKAANRAANTLYKYIKIKIQTLRDDEKQCPYCAEIIKREARICRICQKNV